MWPNSGSVRSNIGQKMFKYLLEIRTNLAKRGFLSPLCVKGAADDGRGQTAAAASNGEPRRDPPFALERSLTHGHDSGGGATSVANSCQSKSVVAPARWCAIPAGEGVTWSLPML